MKSRRCPFRVTAGVLTALGMKAYVKFLVTMMTTYWKPRTYIRVLHQVQSSIEGTPPRMEILPLLFIPQHSRQLEAPVFSNLRQETGRLPATP